VWDKADGTQGVGGAIAGTKELRCAGGGYGHSEIIVVRFLSRSLRTGTWR
jgi:hypothetical protein